MIPGTRHNGRYAKLLRNFSLRRITFHYVKFAHARLRGLRPRRSDTFEFHSVRPLSPVSSLPLQPVSARATHQLHCLSRGSQAFQKPPAPAPRRRSLLGSFVQHHLRLLLIWLSCVLNNQRCGLREKGHFGE